MAQNFTVPKYEQGMATVQKLNEPLAYIENALNQLSDNISTLTNKSAVIQWQAPLDASVQAGDLVYFDSEGTSAVFKPAIAALLGEPGSQGQSVQAPTSRVQGIVLSVDPPVILRSGYYQSDVILGTLGTGAQAGIYYLSPTNAGKATMTPGWNMRQPCLSYYGDGKFSMFSNYLAHDNHHHGTLTISAWTDAASYTGTNTAAGNFVYEIKDTDLIGQLSQDTTAVFMNGLLNTDDFVIQDDAVWYTGTKSPAANSVILFNSYPFAYGDSVVRSIHSNTFSTSYLNGTYVIDMPEYSKVQLQGATKALVDIGGKTVYTAPVVSAITAGLGISVTNMGNGKYQIDSTDYAAVPLLASDIRLNGTQRVADDLLTYTVFPSGATTSYIMTYNLGYNKAVKTGSVKVWVTQKGPGTGRLNVSLYWLPVDTSGAQYTAIPGTFLGSCQIACSNTSTTSLAYAQSQSIEGIVWNKPGTLLAKVQSVTPGKDIYIFQTGFSLMTTSGETGVISDSSSIDNSEVLDVLSKVLTYNANY